jgi:glyoxylase I family protein
MGDYMPELLTIAHVSLTVSDLDRSVPWYERVFDAKLVPDDESGPFRRAALIVAGQALVGLQEFPDPADNLPFNERRVGLDHLAFACSSRRELEAWKVRLDELGVVNGGVVDAGYGSVLSFRDPDNIALEFFAPPS